MLRFGQIKLPKEKFYNAKKPLKVWDVSVDNMVISKFVETKNKSKYFCIKTISF